jgi:hypothetical protein
MDWPSGTSIDSQDTLNFSLLTGVRAMSEVFPLCGRSLRARDERKGTLPRGAHMGDSTITSH